MPVVVAVRVVAMVAATIVGVAHRVDVTTRVVVASTAAIVVVDDDRGSNSVGVHVACLDVDVVAADVGGVAFFSLRACSVILLVPRVLLWVTWCCCSSCRCRWRCRLQCSCRRRCKRGHHYCWCGCRCQCYWHTAIVGCLLCGKTWCALTCAHVGVYVCVAAPSLFVVGCPHLSVCACLRVCACRC